MKKFVCIILVLLMLCCSATCFATSKFDRYSSYLTTTESIEELFSVLIDELDYLMNTNGTLDETETQVWFMYAKGYVLAHEIWMAQSAAMMYDEIPDWTKSSMNVNDSVLSYIDGQYQDWLDGETTQADAMEKVRKMVNILKERNTSTQ